MESVQAQIERRLTEWVLVACYRVRRRQRVTGAAHVGPVDAVAEGTLTQQ